MKERERVDGSWKSWHRGQVKRDGDEEVGSGALRNRGGIVGGLGGLSTASLERWNAADLLQCCVFIGVELMMIAVWTPVEKFQSTGVRISAKPFH